MSQEFPRRFVPAAEVAQEGLTQALSTEETLSFLDTQGVLPLTQWKEGSPILVVLDEETRNNDAYYEKDLPKSQRPSIVRLDRPTSYELVQGESGTPHARYGITNEQKGQVDYYAIDSLTKKPVLIKTSYTHKTKDDPYFAKETALFAAKDDLFPKSNT